MKLADPHNGGQTAVLFESEGKKYIYKPRSPQMDFAWAEFVGAMGELLNVEVPGAVRPVSGADEAFTIVPFIEGREARSEAEVRRYYERCGTLLAFVMLLGSVDLHSENLIADGDTPYLVDLETVLSGITPDKAARKDNLYDSIVFSHLLPNWMLVDGENVDVGALTAAGKNQPRLNGAACPAWKYADEICAGFRKAFSAILLRREAVERELARFAHAPVRKLLRPTDLYGRLCGRIASIPDEDGKRACAERLRRAYLRGGEAWAEQMKRACESEIRAVLRGDIPYFFGYGDERCLRDMDGVVAGNYFAYSPVEAAGLRLRAMRAADGEAQERVIRQSLMAVCPEISVPEIRSAMDVFGLLEAQAIEGNPCSWMGLDTDERGAAFFQSIGFDLYSGLTGVLCFYASLYEACGDRRVRQAIDRRYAPYREMYIAEGGRVRTNGANISLTNGVGGHILALSHMARCLGDESYLRDAALLLKRFDFSEYDDFGAWDVFGGAAGLLIALPALIGCGMDGELAEIAGRLARGVCGTDAGLTGYGHGAAGLALGLAAAQKVGGGTFDGEILRLLEWENALYDEGEMNWPDLRDPEKQGFMKGICSGAPGIGLARAQLMRLTRNERIREICRQDNGRVGAYYKNKCALLRRDSLCCGNAAQAEAERVLTGQNDRARMNVPPVFFRPLDTNSFPAGLFQGWAGIGYALARQEGAKSSLFVWEVEE